MNDPTTREAVLFFVGFLLGAGLDWPRDLLRWPALALWWAWRRRGIPTPRRRLMSNGIGGSYDLVCHGGDCCGRYTMMRAYEVGAECLNAPDCKGTLLPPDWRRGDPWPPPEGLPTDGAR